MKKFIFIILFVLGCSVTQSATIVGSAGGGTWTNTASWVGATVPTAADDVQLTSASGNITIDAGGAVCRSLDCNTYTGILTHNTSSTITIGDGTAGAGNIALRLVSGMTYTVGGSSSSLISFISTSATVQDVDFGGKTTSSVTFNATSGGSWKYVSGHTTGTAATVTLTKGTLDINGQTCSWGGFNSSNSNTRTLTLGGASIHISSTLTWTTTTTTGLTFSGAGATITLGATSINFAGGGLTYGTLAFTNCGSSGAQLTGGNTMSNLTVTGSPNKTDIMVLNNNQTVLGGFNINGNSAINRVLLTGSTSAGIGSMKTITNTGAAMSWSNCDFRDIGLISNYNASAITGGSGDCYGNSNITFTAAATQTSDAAGTGSFSWSSNLIWTSRVPLPQDNVFVTNAFIAGRTITVDMPRMGRDISFSGAANTPTLSYGLNTTLYGSLNTTSLGAHTSGGSGTTFETRTNSTWTSGSFSWAGSVTIRGVGGSLVLQDNLTGSSGTFTLTLANGTFDANDKNVTCRSMTFSASTARSLLMGNGTWTLTSASAENIWASGASSLTTFNGTNSNIVISDTGSANKIFAGSGLKYGNFTISGGGSGSVDITGATNSFRTFTINAPKTVRFTAGTTNNFTSFVSIGTAANTNTISSLTAASHFLSQPSGTIAGAYMSLTNSVAQGGASWYAGSTSVDRGGNTGWIFTDVPAAGVTSNSGSMLLMGVGN